MRWLLGFALLLLALGTLRVVGCGEEAECMTDADCDDQSACTIDYCHVTGRCSTVPDTEAEGRACVGVKDECIDAGAVCESAGVAGFCYYDRNEGIVCAPECQTQEECDDGLECTRNECKRQWYGASICVTYDTCNDGNVCTADRCDRVAGECSYEPLDGRDCGACTRRVPCWIQFCFFPPCEVQYCCTSRAGVCRDGVCVVQ